MKILPEWVAFEWDAGNLDKNWVKHKVRNQEAEEAFFDPQAQIFEDSSHSESEKRHMLWGATGRGRKLTIIFTLRNGKIRVISARDMHRKEKKTYEKLKEDPEI